MSARACTLLLALVCLGSFGLGTAPAQAQGVLPSGFRDDVEIEDLHDPTAVRFTPGGGIFIAQKGGAILYFESFADTEPTVFADLRKQVYDNGDRGLLGLELDPDFPAKPYVYALYTFDHVLGEDAPGAYPRWGQAKFNYEGDPCPKPGGADVDACPVSGRLVRLTDVNHKASAEKVLVEDWCQQDSSHSIGSIGFGPEGALFASGGEGASFISSDYGQFGWPHKNQCGDPPGGENLQPPSAEGGSLRSQDLLTPYDPLAAFPDPTGLAGTLIRIDPETGEGWPGNPMAASTDVNERRIVGFGFRNPFRFAVNPRSKEVYVGNVGNGSDEEIDRVPFTGAAAYNSGWPCYEGPEQNDGFSGFGLNLCEELYDTPGSTSEPFYYYSHASGVSPDDTCTTANGSAITGASFYEAGEFPAEYENALFFGDSVRGCIYVMLADADGDLNPLTTRPFLSDGGPYTGADIQVGPDGDLFYLSLYGDEGLHRVSFDEHAPIARISSDKEWGALPLKVKLDAGASTDPDGEALSYEWDLDENGSFETKGGSTQMAEFNAIENAKVYVRVEDQTGHSSTAVLTIYAGDTPPQVNISQPAESLTWEVGQTIDFAGSAKAKEGTGATIPVEKLYWRSSVLHCPGGVGACHAHPLQVFPAVASGELVAPDHDYPSKIKLTLTATDSRGLSATKTIELQPKTAQLQIASVPAGIPLTASNLSGPAPFSFTAIKGTSVTLAAPQEVDLGGVTYTFKAWSDGGARVHSLAANGSATYTATYSTPGEPEPEPEPEAPGPEVPSAPGGGSGSQPPAAGSGGGSPPPSVSPAPIAGPTISGHPARRTVRTTARFVFGTTVAGAGYRCRIDEKPFAPCGSPRIYRKLAPGNHVFRVEAEAPGEGTELSPAAVFRWRVL